MLFIKLVFIINNTNKHCPKIIKFIFFKLRDSSIKVSWNIVKTSVAIMLPVR